MLYLYPKQKGGVYLQDDRDHLPERNFREEAGAEISPSIQTDWTDPSLQEVQEGASGGTALGMIGLVLSLSSLLTFPFLLSLLGSGVGFVAYRRGAVGLGKWSIGIGLISLIGAMVFAPFLG